MRLAVSTFCDAASVRESLLNVLGAGICLVRRSAWPAPLGVSLAFLLEVEDESVGPLQFRVELRADSEAEPVAVIEGGWLDLARGTEGAPIQLPVIVPMYDVLLPGPGHYVCSIDVAGQLYDTLPLLALQDASVPGTFDQEASASV